MVQSSINFERVTTSNLNHNDRSEFIEPGYLLHEKYRLINEILNTAIEAKQLLKNLLEEAGINFKEKYNQTLQAKSYLWEAIVNLNENHDIKDLQKLVKKLEKETGFTCVQISNHKDEGHIEKDKEGNKVAFYNHHAHLTFFTLDIKSGLQLYRKDISKPERRKLKAEIEAKYALEPEPICEDIFLKRKWTKNSQRTNFRIRALVRERNFVIYNKERLSSLQTMVAEELDMERGTVSVEAEARKLGVEVVQAAARMGHKAFKQSKKNEENSPLLANKVANVKELEVLVKNYKDSEMELEARAENVIWDMKVEFEQEKQVLEAEVTEKVNELEELKVKNDALEESSANLVETKDAKISELQSDITFHQIIDEQRVDKVNTLQTEIESHQKSVKDKVTQIEELGNASLASETQHKEKIEVKDNEILSLSKQVQELKKEVFSETWTWISTDGKKYKSKNIDVVKHLESERKELKEDIETLKILNNTLTISIEQKEIQVALDSNILKDSQVQIKVLKKQVQELEDKETEIIEVLKEVPVKLTPEEIMQSVIETEYGFMKIEDVIKKQKEIIVKKSKKITELTELAYTGNSYKNRDEPFPYKQRSKNQKEEITELKKQINKQQKYIDAMPTQLSIEQDALHIANITAENSELRELVYFDDLAYDHEAQAPYVLERRYKDVVENYKKDIDRIDIIYHNISEYLNLTPEKLVKLFEDGIPSKNKVSLSEIVKIKKEVSNVTSSFPKI